MINNKILSCEIGISNIKLAIIEFSDDEFFLNYFDKIKFNGEKNLSLIRKFEMLADKLNELRESKKYTKSKISISVLDDSVSSRQFLLPQVPAKEEKDTLFWSIKDVGISPDESYLKYLFNRQKIEKTLKQNEYYVSAISKDTMRQCLDILKDMGFKPLVYVDKNFVLYSLYTKIHKLKQNEIVSLINFQKNNTLITIIAGSGVLFSRLIPMGSYNITKLLMDRFSISEDKADELKRDIINNTLKEEFKDANMLVTDFITRFTDNIHRTFDFFSTQEHSRRLDKIVLLGSNSTIKYIFNELEESFFSSKIEILSENLNINVNCTYNNLKPDQLKNYSVSLVGLYLKNTIKMDLLPPSFNLLRKNSSFAIGIYTALLVITISVFMFFAWAKKLEDNLLSEKQKQKELKSFIKTANDNLYSKRKELETKQNKIKQLNNELENLKKVKLVIESRQADIEKFVEEKTKYSYIFPIINTSIIKNVWLDKIVLLKTKAELSGISMSQKNIIQFIKNLEANSSVSSVILKQTKESDFNSKNIIKFIIAFNFKYE